MWGYPARRSQLRGADCGPVQSSFRIRLDDEAEPVDGESPLGQCHPRRAEKIIPLKADA